MKNLIIFCVFAFFCINYSYQRPLKTDALFAAFKNFKNENKTVKAIVPPPLIRHKRGIDLGGLGLDSLGLDENTLKDLTGKITDLLGGGKDGGTKCQVIVNNGGGGDSAGNDAGKDEPVKPEPTKDCGPHGRLC